MHGCVFVQLLLDCGLGGGAVTDGGTEAVVAQHRVLIFCQLKSMLDMVEHDLLKPKLPTITYLRLDGSVPAGQRHAIVSRYVGAGDAARRMVVVVFGPTREVKAMRCVCVRVCGGWEVIMSSLPSSGRKVFNTALFLTIKAALGPVSTRCVSSSSASSFLRCHTSISHPFPLEIPLKRWKGMASWHWQHGS